MKALITHFVILVLIYFDILLKAIWHTTDTRKNWHIANSFYLCSNEYLIEDSSSQLAITQLLKPEESNLKIAFG